MADVWDWVMSWPETLRFFIVTIFLIIGINCLPGKSNGVGGGSAGSMREK